MNICNIFVIPLQRLVKFVYSKFDPIDCMNVYRSSSSFRTQRCHPRLQGFLGISPGSGPSAAGKRLGTSLVRSAYAGSKTFQMAN